MNNDSDVIGGPGIPAFVAFVFLVIALWLLMRNMNGRLRRMSYRHKLEDDADRPGSGASRGSGLGGPTRDSAAPNPGDVGSGGDGGAGGDGRDAT